MFYLEICSNIMGTELFTEIWFNSRNFPNYYYTVNYNAPGDTTLDIIMLDTILLCGNTKYDSEHDQPVGPEDQTPAESQWQWIEQQLADSKYDSMYSKLSLKPLDDNRQCCVATQKWLEGHIGHTLDEIRP